MLKENSKVHLIIEISCLVMYNVRILRGSLKLTLTLYLGKDTVHTGT